MNLGEITHYDDPTDQWAAEHEYALRERRYAEWRLALAWAESRELWMRLQAWLREGIRRTGEQIRDAIMPALQALTASMQEAAEAIRRFALAAGKEPT